MVQREIKKKTRLYGTTAVLSAIVLISMIYVFGVTPLIFPPAQAMKTFSSTQEITDYLNTNTNQRESIQGYGTPLETPLSMVTSYPAPEIYWAKPSDDYSTTNIQVSGVDELDAVKTDGQYIYMTSTTTQTSDDYTFCTINTVYIIDANSQKPTVVSKITLDDITQPIGLFLSQDSNQIAVLANKYDYPNDIRPIHWGYNPGNDYTCINVYDISNKAQPILTRNCTLSGNYANSRMIGDIVYTVVSQPARVYDNIARLPVVYEDNCQIEVSPASIYYTDMNDSSLSFTSFYGLNITDYTSKPTSMTVMMGSTSNMYVSTQNFYVTYPLWNQEAGQYTTIYRVAIDGLQLSCESQGSVFGNILNQYSMDEYNGDFRIATNYYNLESQTQVNNVYVLNSELIVIGKLEGLAPNENLHAARFMGDKGYLVTFKTIDPLFVIDLSNPSNPKVLGELKIPGYSDYLHPYDENHLIGIGKETTESDTGNFAWYQGLKLSLFDVTNVREPIQLTSYGIGDRGTESLVLSDPHAFLFNKERNLLVIPVGLALINSQTEQDASNSWLYGESVWQGAYIFSLSTDGGFTLKGTVTHLNPALLNTQGHLRDPYEYYNTQNDWITRTLYIGNNLYTISNSQIKLTNLTNMTPTATIKLQ
ncbi:beta-propeller domain-containing protein [Candidatus Bathycorpusculum sp.]|uniref:beta-propeller domain-containing protein n=1 Tax=Candidatus Bathycorpusculum sp. TaxID=2994959 RepID=UPI00281B0D61|nr:beta-propeller domain-containing protein [Candidatus Termitimicrobium sp.]MCL2685407.1 beta-propeller domain-containing protein [Candidatus Termitimicrobium sp.]